MNRDRDRPSNELNKDSKPHVPESDSPAERRDELDPDATVEETREFDPDATVEETGDFDPDATVEETGELDPDATVEETRGGDPDATVEETAEFDPNATVEETHAVDPSAITVEDAEDGEATVDEAINVFSRRASVSAEGKRLDETAETLAQFASGGTRGTTDSRELNKEDDSVSVLDDTDLSQTINPRALSDAEAKYWSEISAEFTSDREPTAMPPPIDRTIVETQLQLRNQIVSTQAQAEIESSDYRLVRLLGRGGMGNVFVARQGSLDRLIAVKVIRPLDETKRQRLAREGKLEKVEQSRRQQFLSEAVVTGDLDHPNIVPIHDVAVTGDSTLFYSMKRVVGTPWSEVIGEKTRDENLEILIKIADAIGFAHTRGVVHRDIKPENVMLGDFGVVMVMDWGIALAKPEFEKLDSITPATGLGGTPSMMAPEMAMGPIQEIGPAADIYLLGATLFMIITGKPPHAAANVSECLRAVASNQIRQFDPQHAGELMNIALRAMATAPAERYTDTTEFQDAIREYRSHAESISLATRALDDMQVGNAERSYPHFTHAQFGFEEALTLWQGNETARQGLRESKLDYAEAAYQNGDFDLGLSLLNETNPEHVPLIGRLLEAQRLRQQSQTRFALLKKAAIVMVAIILIGGSVAFVINKKARSVAERQREIAERRTVEAVREKQNASRQRGIAEEQTLIAEDKKREADDNALLAQENAQLARKKAELARVKEAEAIASAQVAREQRDRADASAQAAEKAKANAEYEAYVSSVGLAKARIDRNEFTEARRLIEELIAKRTGNNAKSNSDRKTDTPKHIPWELRYLSSLTNQSSASLATSARATDIAIADSAPSTPALIRFETGNVASLKINTTPPPSLALDDSGKGRKTSPLSRLLRDENVTAIAIRKDGTRAAAGTQRGDILVFSPRDLEVVQLDHMANSVASRHHPPSGRVGREVSARPPRPEAGRSSQREGDENSPPAVLRLSGHRQSVTCLQLIGDDYLVSASTDRTIRVWNLPADSEYPPPRAPLSSEETLWHLAPVVDLAAAQRGSGFRVAAAVAEKGLGQVALWNVQTTEGVGAELAGVFQQHEVSVSSVAISPHARLVASGDVDGNVLLWKTSQLKRRDIESLVKHAVQSSTSRQSTSPASSSPSEAVHFTRLNGGHLGRSDHANSTGGERKSSAAPELASTHQGAVRNLTFSSTAATLLSCGDDYLIHQWGIEPRFEEDDPPLAELKRTLRGHGGTVLDAEFFSTDDERVLSVGTDQSIRMWVSGDAVTGNEMTNRGDRSEETLAGIQPTPIHVHQAPITSASLSADGTEVVTASQDRTAKVMKIDPATLQFESTIELLTDDEPPAPDRKAKLSEIADLEEGSTFRAMAMRVNPKADRLFVGAADAVIRVWSIRRGTEVGRLPGTGLNQAFAVSRDTRVLLTGSSSPQSRSILWRFDPKTNHAQIMHRLSGHQESVAAVAISPDTSQAITADRAGRIRLWNVVSGAPVDSPIDLLLGTRMNDAVFTPDGKSIWVAADDQRLSRIDLASREVIDRLDHDGFVTRVDLSADGRRAITVSELQKIDSTVHRATWWQLSGAQQSQATSKTLATLTVSSGMRTRSGGRPGIASATLDAAGTHGLIAVNPPGDQPSRVERWGAPEQIEEAEKELVFGLPTPLGDVSAAESVSENELMTLHGNSTFRWNTRSRNLEMSYRISGALSVAAFSPNAGIVASGSRSVKLWDADSGDAIGKLESPHQGLVRSIVFVQNPDLTEFYTGGDDGMIRHWSFDPVTSQFSQQATIGESELTDEAVVERPLSLTLSPDGQFLLATTSRGRVVLHDLAGKSQRVLLDEESVGEILAGCFSPDGTLVAAGGADRLARLWDVSQSRATDAPPDSVFRGHAEAINDVALIGSPSPTDSDNSTLRLFTASGDRSVRVWDPRINRSPERESTPEMPESRGRELLELVRHSDAVTAVDFNAEATLMMTAGRDGNVILWPAPR